MSDVLRKFPQRFVTQQIPGQRPSLVKVSLATMTVEMMGCGTLVARVLGPDGKPAPHVPVELANYFSTNLLDRSFKRVFSVSDAHGVAIFRNLREGLLSVSYPAGDPSSLGRNVLADLTPQQRADGAAWIESHKLPYPGLRWSQTMFLQDADMPGLTIDLSECKSSLSGQVIDSKGQAVPDLLVCLNHISTPDREDIDPLPFDRLMRKFVERKHPDISSYFKDDTIVDVNGASLKSDREGKFQFSGIRQGKSKLSVYRRVPTATGPFAGMFEREVLVKEEYLTLEPNKPLTDLEIRLPDLPVAPPVIPVPRRSLPQDSLDNDAQQKIDKPGFKTITARVVDSKGKPVPNAEVKLTWHEKNDKSLIKNWSDQRESVQGTDTQGRFSLTTRLGSPPVDNVHVSIKVPDYVFQLGVLDLTRNEKQELQKFTVLRPAKIVARVKGSNGKPVYRAPFASCSVSDFGDGPEIYHGKQQSSSDDGAVEVTNVSPGDVTLCHSSGGESRLGGRRCIIPQNPWNRPVKHRFWVQHMSLREGETRHLDIDFSICTGGIRGRLVDQDNRPVVGKSLNLEYSPPPEANGKSNSFQPASYVVGSTDSDGKFEISGLQPGTYKVHASEPYSNNRDAISPPVTVEVTGDKAVEFDLKATLPAAQDVDAKGGPLPAQVGPARDTRLPLTPLSPEPNRVIESRSVPRALNAPKELHLTVLGVDKKPLPDALIAVLFKSTERSLERTHYAVSNAQGEITMNFPDEGLVNLVYPVWLGPPGMGLDPADPDTFKFEQNLRRVLGTSFRSLAEHFPVKDILYAKMIEMRNKQTTRCTIDLSDCRTPATLRFVDDSNKPLKPQFLQLRPEFNKLVPHIDAMFDRSSFFYPLSLKIGNDGVLTLGKMNPGAFLISWEDPQQHSPHSIPLSVRENKPLDLTLKIKHQPQIEVSPTPP
ncbi:MAG: carboxypeptidase-like regulatory domain-containing protein [Planctomycetales bacterium]